MQTHKIVGREEWMAASRALLVKEKAFTRAKDALSEERRALPWMRVEKSYLFDGPDGPVSLAELFGPRNQLVMQHFMFGPDWEEGCTGCSFLADHVDAARQHFEHDGLSFAAVSRAPLAKLEAYRRRMGWRFTWVSSLRSDFNFDFDVSYTPRQIADRTAMYNFEVQQNPGEQDLHGTTVFFKDEDGAIFRTYSTYARGADGLLGAYAFLDLTPLGRNEKGAMNDWLRRHDRYDDQATAPAREEAVAGG